MMAHCDAFLASTLQSCHILIEGVAGNTVVTTMGTAEMYVQDCDGVGTILRMANCLMNPDIHTLLSLSQFQHKTGMTVTLTNTNPTIIHTDDHTGSTVIPLYLDHGTYVLPFCCLDATDPRRQTASVLKVTTEGPYTPPSSVFPDGRLRWRATRGAVLPVAYAGHRLCVPLRVLSSFRARVAALTDSAFVDSTTRPRVRRTYE